MGGAGVGAGEKGKKTFNIDLNFPIKKFHDSPKSFHKNVFHQSGDYQMHSRR